MSERVWILRGFDRATERQVERFELGDVTDDEIRRMLKVAPEEDVVGGWDVPAGAVAELERIIGRALRADLDYQIDPRRRA